METRIAILCACVVACIGCANQPSQLAGDPMPAGQALVTQEEALKRTNEDIPLGNDEWVKVQGAFDVKDGKVRAWGPDGQPSSTLYTDLLSSQPKLSPEARSKFMPDQGDAGPFVVMESPTMMVNGDDLGDWNLSKLIRWEIEDGCELPAMSITILPMTTDTLSQTGAAQFNYGRPIETAKFSMGAKSGDSLNLCDIYALIDKVEVAGGKTTYSLSIQGLGAGKTLDLKAESIAAEGKPTRDILTEHHWIGTSNTADPLRVTLTYPTSAKVLTFSLQAKNYDHTTRYGIPAKPNSDVMKLFKPELAKKPLALNSLPRTNKDLKIDQKDSISVVGIYEVSDGDIRVWAPTGIPQPDLRKMLIESRTNLRPEARAKYLPERGNAGPFAAVYCTKGVILQNTLEGDLAITIPIKKVFELTRRGQLCSIQILPMIQDPASKTGAVRIDYSSLKGEGSIRYRSDYAEMLADPNRKPITIKRNHPLTPVSSMLRYGLPLKPLRPNKATVKELDSQVG